MSSNTKEKNSDDQKDCVPIPGVNGLNKTNYDKLFRSQKPSVKNPKKEDMITAATDALKTWIGFGKSKP